jgi:putative effector of murein hydrolase
MIPAVLGATWALLRQLASMPLLWFAATVAAYEAGCALNRRCGGNPLVNPVLFATCILGGGLLVTDTPFEVYAQGSQGLYLLLAPATVALAVPVHRHLPIIRRCWPAILLATGIGGIGAAVCTVSLAHALGAAHRTVLSLAPKSATAAISIVVSDAVGGIASLTAVSTILTGVFGAMFALPLLRLLRIRDPRAIGFGLGVASHAIGTATALGVSEVAGAFSAVGLIVNGTLTAMVVPAIVATLPT